MRIVKRGFFAPKNMAVIAAAAVMMTAFIYAASGSEKIFVNNIKSGSVKIMVRQYEQTDEGKRIIQPGQILANRDVSYIPEITNLRAESYVRVKVDFLMDKYISAPVTMADTCGIGENWVKCGEYYYYTEQLSPMETVQLFTGIHIPESWDSSDSAGFSVHITADAVQASGLDPDFESAMPWGSLEIKEEKAGDSINYRETSAMKPLNGTGILTFTGANTFEANVDDLFDNFGYFMAGSAFEDRLIIRNSSERPVKISFCTAVDGNFLAENSELEIHCDNELFYKGRLPAETLSQYVDLAELEAGEEKMMEFKVSLPVDKDNVYSADKDQVIWKFKSEALGESEGTVRTGDEFGSVIYLVAASLAFVMMLLLAVGRKRKNDKDI